ncbi:MAG: metalloregulator ArsR/SmtB family transcription factor [Anaerolineae bacterium]|jgi:DNA-binding transcriptional ArsR family regulator|nr:metalloregulator ArsR/SmtB family transcription factor [Anaerolineae bacterium]
MNQLIHQFKAEFFKALAHPARLAILEQLRTGEKSVGELQAGLNADQSTVSQHLARLRASDLVQVRKEGTTAYYSIRDPAIFELMDVAKKIFNNQLVDRQALLRQLRNESRSRAA